MLKKYFLVALMLLGLLQAAWGIDAGKLLPADQAFVPQITARDDGVAVRFTIADGYYLYRSKIIATTQPPSLLGGSQFVTAGKSKSDEFFGRQVVYYHQAEVFWPYTAAAVQGQPYALTLSFQGCADAGICYPPVQTTIQINGEGSYSPHRNAAKGNPFLQPDSNNPVPRAPAPPDSSRFTLSWSTLSANLLAFFIAGVGLSLTACMYPLLPIVSSIIVGDRHAGKCRAFVLSAVYVQGLALTYTLVGIVAGMTGALLTVWLQQRWVVLSAAAVLVVLALSLFGLYPVQLPSRWQSYFNRRSQKLSSGHLASVWVMGMLSALIVGPCVAPPLALALGYIGQTGDALLGGLALYVLALGTGVPLMLVATFGGHFLPRAGAWMNGIKYGFGLLLLGVAVYMATPFLPYAVVVTAYALLLLIPAVWLLLRWRRFSGNLRIISAILGVVLLSLGGYFVAASVRQQTTFIHQALSLNRPASAHFGRVFLQPADLDAALRQAFAADPSKPVLVDFYADWCVSCKKMAANTFSDTRVRHRLEENRFLQLNVTANTPAQQAMLRKYGLYGPPGLFMVYADGQHSAPLLGSVPPDALLLWYQQNNVHQ